MTTTTHPASGFSFPHVSRRVAVLVVAAVLAIAAAVSVAITQIGGSSGGSHSTSPGVYRIQHLGVAGQNGEQRGLGVLSQ